MSVHGACMVYGVWCMGCGVWGIGYGAYGKVRTNHVLQRDGPRKDDRRRVLGGQPIIDREYLRRQLKPVQQRDPIPTGPL